MTAMGESSLTNVDRGDAVRGDTKWVFQQGPEWGPEEVRKVPYGAAGLFFDALVKVEGYRQLAPTIAAHRVQRNADPFHYAPFWDDAVQMMAAMGGGQVSGDPNAADCAMAGQSDSVQGPGQATAPAAAPATPRPSSSRPVTTRAPVALLKPPPAPALTRPARELDSFTIAGKELLGAVRCIRVAFPDIPMDADTATSASITVTAFRTPTGRANGWVIANWLKTYAGRLGLKTVIYDGKIWRAGTTGWTAYMPAGGLSDDTVAHRDHIALRTS